MTMLRFSDLLRLPNERIEMRKGRHAKGVGRHADLTRKVKMFGKPKGGGRHAKR